MNHDLDGIDHINIYSKGQTELGRYLSNFSHTSIETDDDGCFESIEGYWYWLGCKHPEKDRLRKVWGNEAKTLGKELRSSFVEDSDFKYKIKRAIFHKLIRGSSELLETFIESNLPFSHYYVYDDTVIDVPECQWLVSFFEEFRLLLKPLLAEMKKEVIKNLGKKYGH